MSESQTTKRRLQGVVMSDKMDKTAVVKVDRTVVHSKYLKRFKVSKRYKAHDPDNTAKIGDEVIIEECRPMGKSKTWRIVTKKA